MSKLQNSSRNVLDMGSDVSLQERIQNSAYYLMRSKGKYRERLIDVALELARIIHEVADCG